MDGFTLPRIFINLLIATKWTIILSLIAFVGGGLIGALVALMRISSNKVVNRISWIYVDFFEGTPLLLQLFLAFFGISIVTGINLSPLVAASLALTAYTSAFLGTSGGGPFRQCPEASGRRLQPLALATSTSCG